MDDFPVICYTDGSKIDGRDGFAFVVFRSGVESEHFQFRIYYLICTDSLSSLHSLRYIFSSNNIIVEIQKRLKSLKDKNTSISFAFVRGYTGVLGNDRADWLARAATKREIDIEFNIPKSFYKKIMKERMVKSWDQEYFVSNKASLTKKFLPTISSRDYPAITFILTGK
ncbi:RNase H domain-containing protein [Trichonephila clavipes]|nr:RNase H domain-containing protein [Trichonephila clavipes]